MGSAAVKYKEIDLSTRVASFPSIKGAIVLPSLRGKVGERELVTSDIDLLRKYTPHETIEVGMSNGFFSALAFLQKAEQLEVVRAAASDASYGGVSIESVGSVSANASLVTGEVDPTAYTFGTSTCFLVHQKDQGDWGKEFGIRVITDQDIVKEADAFIIEVYAKSNDNVALERHIVSRIQNKKDGFNRNIYIESVLESSSYISVVDNLAIAETVLPIAQPTTLYMDGGLNGTAVTDAEMIQSLSALENKDDVEFTLIMDGDWTTPAFQIAMDSLVSGRQDCVALLSTPYAAEASASYMSEINAYRSTDLNLNSSYSALYTPHVKIYDQYNGRNIYVAPDGYAAAAIAATASAYEIWYPPAGFKRGLVNVLDTRRRFSQGEMDSLYDNGINPIRFAPSRGIVIWGQKTLLSRPSKLQSLHIRLLLITIGPAITKTLENFLFDLNDAATRSEAVAIIDSYMEGIEAKRGVSAFKTISDSSNNTDADIAANRMIVDLFILPTGSVEEIPFRLVITREGVDFSVAAQSL